MAGGELENASSIFERLPSHSTPIPRTVAIPNETTGLDFAIAKNILEGRAEQVEKKPPTSRLLDKSPDASWLLVGLERENFVSLRGSDRNRRVVEVSITEKGQRLLDRLDEPVDDQLPPRRGTSPQTN